MPHLINHGRVIIRANNIAMILSHKHKFIFIKTQKTAGTSIEIALSRICGQRDIIAPISMEDEKHRCDLGYRGSQNYVLRPKLRSRKDLLNLILFKQRKTFYNHIPAVQIKELIGRNIWDNYYKFCFERNPFDKIISWYYWNGGKTKYPSIMDFMKAGKAGEIKGFDLYTINSLIVVDKVYKYEELSAAMLDITERLNLSEPLELPTTRAKAGIRKDKGHYREILTNEEVEWISKTFAREMACFNYEF